MSILSPQIDVQTQTFHATLAALGQYPSNANGHVDASSPRLDEAIEKWRKIVAASEPQQWTRRLAWDGLNEHSARVALSNEWQAKGESPAWIKTLAGIRAAIGKASNADNAAHIAHHSPTTKEIPKAFQEIWNPVAAWASAQLQSSLPAAAKQTLTTTAWGNIESALLTCLSNIGESVLMEVFNRERDVGMMLLAHLGDGDDAASGPTKTLYSAFVKRNCADSLGAILGEFPILGRLLATTVDLWVLAMGEFLRRLAADRTALSSAYAVDVNASISQLTLGLSDPHRGGRVVVIIHFAGNTADAPVTKVVYKPKDIRLDGAYQRALRALPVAPGQPALRSLNVIVCDGYGYMEYVQHRPAKDDAELHRFYTYAGRLTAVLHILGCTDCHYENLIADGDQLVLIDTETLFEAKLRDLINEAAAQPQSHSEMQKRFSSAVTRSGLLPAWLFMGETKKAIDISALGSEPPAEATQEIPGWLGINSDGMMSGVIEQPSEVPTSLPYLVGQSNRFNEFLEPFCDGFREELLQLIVHRGPWIAPGGILDSFRGLPRRIVMRATRIYFQIMMQLMEPDALRSASAQGLLLEKLALAFLSAQNKPKHWNVFKAELRDMELLDIPFFEHSIDGLDLPLAHGLEKVDGFIESSGLESSRTRLSELDNDEIDLQLRLIRGVSSARWIRGDAASAVSDAAKTATTNPASAVTATSNQTANTTTTSAPPPKPLTQQARLHEATRLGEVLQRDAIFTKDGRVDWLGLSLGNDSERMSYGLLGSTLYAGTAGIAVFLAALGSAHLPLARSCMSEVLEFAHNGHAGLLWRWWRDQPLGINGCGGTLLALEILRQADPAQSDRYATAVDRLIGALQTKRLTDDKDFDIIAGSSGMIGALLQCATPQAIEFAMQAGDHILAGQQENGSWKMSNKKCYTGFSHGIAGISAALSALYRVTGEKRFVQNIHRSLALEKSKFDNSSGNWISELSDTTPSMTTWCHGAPGIALARLCLQRNKLTAIEIGAEAHAQVRSDFEIALSTTTKFVPPMQLDHLCCGNFGRSGILRLAGRTADADRCEAIAHAAVAQQGGLYRYGATAQVETPGLFRGSAGVGLVLLQSPFVSTVLSAGLLPWK